MIALGARRQPQKKNHPPRTVTCRKDTLEGEQGYSTLFEEEAGYIIGVISSPSMLHDLNNVWFGEETPRHMDDGCDHGCLEVEVCKTWRYGGMGTRELEDVEELVEKNTGKHWKNKMREHERSTE